MENIIREKVAFDAEHRGFRFVATYLTHPKGEALIEISRNGEVLKSILWPAYKIWNIAAHADDIAADMEHGLSMAGEVGFGANVYQPTE